MYNEIIFVFDYVLKDLSVLLNMTSFKLFQRTTPLLEIDNLLVLVRQD